MATESTTLRSPARKRAKLEPSSSSLTASGTKKGPTSETKLVGLCSACQSLLIRPNCNPETQKGPLLIEVTDSKFVLHRLSGEIRHAKGVCLICTLVMAAFKTIEQHSVTAWINGFEMALEWSTKGQFCNIQVITRDSNNRRITWHPSHHGIMLSPTDEPANSCVSYRSPPNTSAKFCQSLAMRWFISCIANHPTCRDIRSPHNWLPTRLIDVGLAGSLQPPRLVSTTALHYDTASSYVTLSHRWASTNVVKLESSNINLFMQRIPIESLSQTFIDSIEFTRSLGVQYIWIDSLCILQDSPEDWQAEALQMDKVYRNCICNIAATGSSDSGGGLFQDRDEAWVTPEKVRIQYSGHDRVYLASLQHLWEKWVCRGSLNRRGWVFQERLLSPRTLHFSSQLFWECRTLQACETFPEGMPEDERDYEDVDGALYPISQKNWSDQHKIAGHWDYLVEVYGRCSITKPDDRLIAIAGVAKSLQPVLDDVYLAGLWKKDLPWNLVWSLHNVEGDLSVPSKYRCPSWSWASLDYNSAWINDLLIYERSRIGSLVNIGEPFMEPLGPDLFGALRTGYLPLTGQTGGLFHITDGDHEGDWINGCYSYEMRIDLASRWISYSSIRCMPLLAWLNGAGHTIIECLLLQPAEGRSASYIRAGLLTVSVDLKDTLPEEIKWIPEVFLSNQNSSKLDTIFLY